MIRELLAFALGAGVAAAVITSESDGLAAELRQAIASGPNTDAGGQFAACFTPYADCTGMIVDRVGQAQRQVLVQAYTFTSAPILKALAEAAARGVDVRVILDRSDQDGSRSAARWLAGHGIAPLIDDQVAIAHNKVMVVDGITVITGSFNFTRAAQERNAENLLVVEGRPDLAGFYTANWQRRAAASRLFAP
ncbi:MAG: phospholipase D family protein [Inquilinus sp.]|uniref:phospholipase D family nuclease n=1 Tax=Inquilinus sp. TaxID=1932117 RepID=UPI003F2CBD39